MKTDTTPIPAMLDERPITPSLDEELARTHKSFQIAFLTNIGLAICVMVLAMTALQSQRNEKRLSQALLNFSTRLHVESKVTP